VSSARQYPPPKTRAATPDTTRDATHLGSPTREELIAENERLRKELLRGRTHRSMWPVIAGLSLHILLRPLLDPWLNAESDAKVSAAVVILAVPVLFAVAALVKILSERGA
jgi:hypothetical protein